MHLSFRSSQSLKIEIPVLKVTMIKFGIYNEVGMKRLCLDGVSSNRKLLALDLYSKASICEDKEKAKEIRQLILQRMSVANGAYKRTYAKRFEVFDSEAINVLLLHRSGFSKDVLIVHDMAISDGSTSVDFYRKLYKALLGQVEFIGSDLSNVFYTIEVRYGRLIFDQSGNLIQMIFPPFVFSEQKGESWLFFPINRIIRRAFKLYLNDRIIRRVWESSKEKKRTLVLCDEYMELLESEKVNFATYDIFGDLPNGMNLVRAMNVLNPSYFSDDEIFNAIMNINASLVEGGFFIVGSNQNAHSVVNGDVFIKQNGGFVSIYRSGKGSGLSSVLSKVS